HARGGCEIRPGPGVPVHDAAERERIDERTRIGRPEQRLRLGPVGAAVEGLEHHVRTVCRKAAQVRVFEHLGEQVRDAVAVRAYRAAGRTEPTLAVPSGGRWLDLR